MKTKKTITHDPSLLSAMLSDDPEAMVKWAADNGITLDPDVPVCLANVPPERWQDCCKVLPTPAIQRYLESGDTLTDHTIDMMELALEKAYGVTAPWYIDCAREGRQATNTLKVRYFSLILEK